MKILDPLGRQLRRVAGFEHGFVADDTTKDAVSGTTHQPTSDEGQHRGAHHTWRQEPYMRGASQSGTSTSLARKVKGSGTSVTPPSPAGREAPQE